MKDNIFIKIESDKQPKMSIHANGKPHFNKLAISLMQLANKKYFKIAKGKNEKCIFLFPVDISIDALKISKVGNYYCFNNINLFRRLGFIRNDSYVVQSVKYKDETIYKICL